MTRKRDQYTIAKDILTVANGGAKITRLTYECNLNFVIIKNHLDALVARGFLAVERVGYRKGQDVNEWTTTDRGCVFIFCMSSVLAMWDEGLMPHELPEVVAQV